MSDGLNDHEDFIRVSRFPSCDRFEVTEDLVFAYPSSEFVSDAETIANELQREMNYLKNVTSLKPREELGSKVVVGYRSPEEGGTGRQSNWSKKDGNRVFLSWGYLEDFDKGEPMDICSHELVHPFFLFPHSTKSMSSGVKVFAIFCVALLKISWDWMETNGGSKRSNKQKIKSKIKEEMPPDN